MSRLLAKDVMNPNVLAARADMTLGELTGFLLENEISGAPVEDRDGHLVGVVSLTDVARAGAEQGHLVHPPPTPEWVVRGFDEGGTEELRGYHIEEDLGLLVAEVMTPAVHSIDEGTPVAEVARVMLESHVHRLLVTRAGRIAGIVTTTDILKVVAASQPIRRVS